MKITPFQAIVLVIFGIAIVGGLIVLAFTKGSSSNSGAQIVIWGTMSAGDFNSTVEGLTQGNKGLKIVYVEKRQDSFDQDLVEALASGVGPDVILLPQDLIIRHRDKVFPIPFSSMPLRTFKDTFIQEAELYLTDSGVIAMPFSVDPLVMYWNRDLLGNAGISVPPSAWSEFLTLVPKLTSKDKNLNILRSGVALGEFRNISNAKEIISAFLLQAGNPIVTVNSSRGTYQTLSSGDIATVGAVNFYSDFSNPVKPDYSWNRALPNSLNMFAAGDLAFYFGFASEISKIRNKNPNLNFDLTYFPQPKGASVLVTFGKMFGLAVMKSSPNIATAITDISAITQASILSRLSEVTGLPPVRRDLLSASVSDPYQAIFYNSAIRSRGWLDPNPSESSKVFQNMIESIGNGEQEVGTALDAAGKKLNDLLQKF